MLRNVVCWVAAEPLANGLGDVLVSRPVMEKLGLDTGSLLEKARENQAEYNMEELDGMERPIVALLKTTERLVCKVDTTEELMLRSWEEEVCFPTGETDGEKRTGGTLTDGETEAVTGNAGVKEVLKSKVLESVEAGRGKNYQQKLITLLDRYTDVFRLDLGWEPPVDMPPLRVNSMRHRCGVKRGVMDRSSARLWPDTWVNSSELDWYSKIRVAGGVRRR
jgi:hypothetical protein